MTISKLFGDFIEKIFSLEQAGTSGALFGWLMETTLIIALLISLVLLIRKPIAKTFGPRATYALWLLPVIRFFLPEFSILKPHSQALMPENLQALLTTYAAPPGASHETMQLMPGIPANTVATPSFILVETAITVWLACALLWFCAQLARQALYHNYLLTNSRPVCGLINQSTNKIAKSINLRKSVTIRLSKMQTGPLVTGLFKPVIILPASFSEIYTPIEQDLALTHELTHIKRGDLWFSFGAMVFRAIQWPNPMVHIAWRAFRADQESSCDALVLTGNTHSKYAKKHNYASALIKSARATHGPALSSQPLSPTSLLLGNDVKERLMLMKFTPTSKRRTIGSIGVSVFIAASLAVTAQYGYASQEETSETRETEIIEKQIFTGNDGKKRKLITKSVSTNGENIRIEKFGTNVVTWTDDDDFSFDMKGKMVFIGEGDGEGSHGVSCISLDEEIKTALNQKDIEESKLEAPTTKTKTKTKKVMIIRTHDENGETITEEIKGEPHMIICKDGEIVHDTRVTPEIEAEGLRTAIEHLKEEEKHAAERIRETRKQLEKRLKDLESKAK